MEKSKKLKIIAGVACVVLLGSVFGGYKLFKVKQFNDLVNSGNRKLKIGNYDGAIASYAEALHINDDSSVKNQILIAQNLKVFLLNNTKNNEKSSNEDKKTAEEKKGTSLYTDAEGNTFEGFTEEEKKILAQVANVNINDPVLNGYSGNSNSYVSNNKSSSSKNSSYSTSKNIASSSNSSNVSSSVSSSTSSYSPSNSISTQPSSPSTSSSSNASGSSSQSETPSSNSSTDSSSQSPSSGGNTSSGSTSNGSTGTSSGVDKEARIQALYQQEASELAPYNEKINSLRQQADQLAQEAAALPDGDSSKADLVKKKASIEQQMGDQIEQCKRIANDYIQKINAIQNQ